LCVLCTGFWGKGVEQQVPGFPQAGSGCVVLLADHEAGPEAEKSQPALMGGMVFHAAQCLEYDSGLVSLTLAHEGFGFLQVVLYVHGKWQ
jgi:hypothetical protein